MERIRTDIENSFPRVNYVPRTGDFGSMTLLSQGHGEVACRRLGTSGARRAPGVPSSAPDQILRIALIRRVEKGGGIGVARGVAGRLLNESDQVHPVELIEGGGDEEI